MSDARLDLRATAMLAVGAFALHQVRYLAGFGDEAGQALAAHGHGYLTLATPLIALVAAVAAGQFLSSLARPGRTGEGAGRAGRFGRLWLAATGALLATYTGQELLEGALSAGHPGGIAAVLAAGGLWAAPLAVALGLAVALLLRGADAALSRAARRARRPAPRRRSASAPSLRAVDLPSPPVIGSNLAGRGPPLASV